ncbi:MAG: hypothetical protein NC310_01210 [Roseburia sp.]|nr:hypothetical protein [Anaeroplasma bactoclasticum]MCM1195672.1 hypothetical protein [Roseburia sp.]MCM1556129.1 hypothetical protein [Anaeroplasma bactoclasticum]
MNPKLEKYIIAKEAFSIPELQKEFHLSYKAIRIYIEKLVQRGKIRSLDELKYSYVRNEEDPLYIYVLWLTIKSSNFAISYLQRMLDIGIDKLQAIIDWMREKQYVKTRPFDRVIITEEQFLSLYGSLDMDCDDPNAFSNWKSDHEEEINQYIKSKTSKKVF